MLIWRTLLALPATLRALLRGRAASIWDAASPSRATRYSDRALDQLRRRADEDADRVVREVADEAAAGGADPDDARLVAVRDLLTTLVAAPYVVPERLPARARAWLSQITLSRDVDRPRLARAYDFFARNAFLITLILGTSALLEAYACPNGMRVLEFTQRLRRDPYRRLSETLQWALLVEDPNGFEPHGRAMAAILKVRLMHAAIRYLAAKQSHWDAASLGEPICAEDLLGMLMGFSGVVMRDLPKLGVAVTSAEAEDHIYLWNVVGELLGAETEFLPRSIAEARELVEAIKRRQQGPSAIGSEFTAALVEFHRALMPGEIFDDLALSVMRRLVGPALSDMLAVPSGEPAVEPMSMSQIEEKPTPEDWGEALISREAITVPSRVRGGSLLYERRGYEIPAALEERWDRERPRWREAHRRLRGRRS